MRKSYACKCTSDELRMKSSSGAVYPLLASKFIANGGIVYASIYDENLNVCHKRIVNQIQIDETCGSKYVSSDLGTSFNDIKRDLEKSKCVLFVGTPCQCAGLYSTLKCSNCDVSNLYVIDFICHGVPSPLAYRSYISSLRSHGLDLKMINMRNKNSGWSNGQYQWEFTKKNGDVVFQKSDENLYMRGFLQNLYLRPSCYNCHFKGIERKTDITLGDYWGVWNLQPEMDDNKGTSAIIIHSEKGMDFFHNISTSLIYEEMNIEEFIQYNPCLLYSVNDNYLRNEFYKDIFKGADFCDVINKLLGNSFISRILRFVYKSNLIMK